MSTLDILKDLQDRVTQLERQAGDQPGQDNLQPNVLTVDPDGTIGANLTGHLKAQGVDLTAGTSATPPSTDRIRWLDATSGAVVADIFGFELAPDNRMNLSAVSPDGNTVAGFILEASNGGSIVEAVANPAQAATILDGLGESSFLQLTTVGKHQINWGSANITWPGAANDSSNTTINHGLGALPAAILLTGGSDVQVPVLRVVNGSVTNTQFKARAWAVNGQPALGTTTPFYWIAIA